MSNDSAPHPFDSMDLDLPEVHPGVTLHGMLEFKDDKEDTLLMLLDTPYDALYRMIDLCSEYDSETKAVVARVISTTALIREGKQFDDIAGVLLHAAVVAPVIAAFSPDGATSDLDKLDNTLVLMQQTLGAYWRCTFSGFRLDADNRFFFARGLAVHVMVSERPVHLSSWKNDKHFMWVGSRFNELKPHAKEILARHDITRATLEEISMRWTVPHRMYNGGLSQQFQIEHYERLFSYEDYYSVIPEDGWEKMRALLFQKNGSMNINLDFRGVTLTSEQHMYLQHFFPDLNEAPFMKLLSSLSDGTGKMRNGDAAMMVHNFGEGTLAFIEDACEDYTQSQRRLISDALNHLALRSEAMDNMEMLEHFALYVSTAAPLLEEFFEHKDEFTGNDILDLLTADADWDALLTTEVTEESVAASEEARERMSSLLWEYVENAFGVFHRVIENVEVTPEKYTFLARGITAVHVVGYQSDITEHEILFIGSHHDTVLKHADTLRVTKDLRAVNLNEIARG